MELLDVYDDNGNITGEYVERGPKTKELEPHKHIAICVIFIENSKHHFLIQKTSEEKDSVFASTGGHVDKGETPANSILREVKEELGIDISNQKIIECERGCDGKDCYIMYYTKMNLDIDKLIIQLDELSEVRWFSIEKLQQMVDTGDLNKNQVEFFIKCVEFLKN